MLASLGYRAAAARAPGVTDDLDRRAGEGERVIYWLADRPEVIMPLLFAAALVTYGLLLGVPSLRTRFLRRLPCVATHAVQVTVDLTDPAAIDRAMRDLHALTSNARWSPVPPSYHVRTTAGAAEDGTLRWRETVVTSTSYHLRRNRAAAEDRLAAYLSTLSREVGLPD
jgi:hypothetical protein